MDEERLPTRTYALALAAIVGLALALRLAGFGSIPPGLYHDEAYNGLDALGVLRGACPLWFSANNGREPFYIYLVALSVAALGRTVAAVRAPALLLGLLTVPATAFVGSSLFNRRVGLLAAAVTAVAFWPLHLSRVGFRAVGLPLFVALSVGFLWRGLRYGRRRDYAAGGFFYGASFYTYLAARFTLVPLLLLAILLCWRGAGLPRPVWRHLGLFVAVALLTVAPLAGYVILQPGVLTARATQVWVFNPSISHGDPWGALGRHSLLALKAFFVRGDRIPRHNLPWRPIFDPALGAAFLAGIGVALRRRQAGWFVLLWVATMMLPTVLAEDAPHFLRGVGIQPLVFVVPALGLEGAWRWLDGRRLPAVGACLVVAALLAGLASTCDAYFRRYAHEQTVYYHFESGSTELATQINAFLGNPAQVGSRVAYVSQHLWRDWPSLRFLVPQSPALKVVSVETPPAPSKASRVLLATWPFERYEPSLNLMPPGSQLEVTADLYERGDLEPEARLLALVFRATPAEARAPAAVFERGIRLVDARADRISDRELRVRLVWEADEVLDLDYTIFVQVLRGQAMLGQDDRPPAGGRLPTTLWRPGDRIVDVHEVALEEPYDPDSDRVIVGLYNLGSMIRLRVVESRTPAMGDAVPVGVP